MPSTEQGALRAVADDLAADVRAADRARFLSLLFAPEAARPALVVLAAYQLELQRIVGRAREPLAAEVRLQWWRDAIRGEGYGAVSGVALADGLREGMARYGWPAETLCAVSEAHIHDLYADPFGTTNAFDGYAGETEGSLAQLGAMALGVESYGVADGHAAARTAATAAGYAGVLLVAVRAIATFETSFLRGRTMVPADLWPEDDDGLKAALSAGTPPESASRAVLALTEHARTADTQLHQLAPSVDPAVRPAFVRSFAASRALRAVGRDPLRAGEPSAIVAQWRLWCAARTLRSL